MKLPNYKMKTVFGRALGIDTIDLAATAASNGNNCASGTACDGTGGTTTTAPPGPTTTLSPEQSCRANATLSFVLDDALWTVCQQWFPNDDREEWRQLFCTIGGFSLYRDGVAVPESWNLDPSWQFLYYWDQICSAYLPGSQRETWLNDQCFATDMSFVYYNTQLYLLCRTRRPGMETQEQYFSTTTTTPTTTTPVTTTIPPPSSSTPTSIDLSG